MSYSTLQPPPPDRLGAPSGARGPLASHPNRPGPGETPLDLGMARPRSIGAAQVVLWIFAAVATVADLVSAVNMASLLSPLSVVSLAYAVYSTVQAVLTSIHIRTGKRWAWIWALVSAVLGLIVAAGSFMAGMVALDTAPLLAGATLAVLCGVLVVLLSSRSARRWVLVNRVKRGEVPVQDVPGPGTVAMAVHVRHDPAGPRPAGFTPAPQPWTPGPRMAVVHRPACVCAVPPAGPHHCGPPAQHGPPHGGR